MSQAEVYDADPETVIQALAGPHHLWESISIEMEGARFHELGELVAKTSFSLDDEARCHELLDELEICAKSAGYADADHYRSLAGGKTEAEIEEDANLLNLRYYMMNPGDGEYLTLVTASESLIGKAAASADARTFVNFRMGDGGSRGPIHARLLAAYEDGRHEALKGTPDARPR